MSISGEIFPDSTLQKASQNPTPLFISRATASAQVYGPANGAAFKANLVAENATAENFSIFIRDFVTNGDPEKKKWEDFIDAFRAEYNPTVGAGTPFANMATNSGFTTLMGNLGVGTTAALTAPWDSIYNIYLTVDPTMTEEGFRNKLFNEAFGAYLKENKGTIYHSFLDAENLGTAAARTQAMDDFFAGYMTFITSAAVMDEAADTTNFKDLEDFKKIFLSNFPDGAANYGQFAGLFYTQFNKTFDYFLPSHALDQWTNEVQNAAVFLPSEAVAAKLRAVNRGHNLLVNDVLKLIISMIETVQLAATSQANRLKFLSEWQQAYAAQMQNIPTYSANDGSLISGTSPNIVLRSPSEDSNKMPVFWINGNLLSAPDSPGGAQYVRNFPGRSILTSSGEINNAPTTFFAFGRSENWVGETREGNSYAQILDDDKFTKTRKAINDTNQTLTETVRARRQLITDEAKQFQSNVSQINDAASSQANIASALLQQLSGVLAMIFR
jgi:hypothetical protein